VVTSRTFDLVPMEWEETRRKLIGRLAGVLWVLGVLISFQLDPARVQNKLYGDLSTPQILDWAAHNGTGISVHALVSPFQWTLWAIATVLTISLLRGRGILAVIGYISVASGMAISWVIAGVMFAMAETAQQAGSDAGVVALFKLAHDMTFTDGFALRLAIASISALIVLTRLLPAPLAWLGGLSALYGLVALPLQLLLTGNIYGITGPLSLLFGLPWILAIGVTLMIKPIWEPLPERAARPAV